MISSSLVAPPLPIAAHAHARCRRYRDAPRPQAHRRTRSSGLPRCGRRPWLYHRTEHPCAARRVRKPSVCHSTLPLRGPCSHWDVVQLRTYLGWPGSLRWRPCRQFYGLFWRWDVLICRRGALFSLCDDKCVGYLYARALGTVRVDLAALTLEGGSVLFQTL